MKTNELNQQEMLNTNGGSSLKPYTPVGYQDMSTSDGESGTTASPNESGDDNMQMQSEAKSYDGY